MSRGWSWKSGDWWLLCDSCQKKIKASESYHRWDGLIVCKDDYETRHPQDFIKARIDKISVPFSRPQAEDSFLAANSAVTIDDPIGLTETIILGITIVPPNNPIIAGSSGDDSLGSTYIAQNPLGGTGTANGLLNTISFSEAVAIDVTLAINAGESFGFTESVAVQLNQIQALANNALASVTLG